MRKDQCFYLFRQYTISELPKKMQARNINEHLAIEIYVHVIAMVMVVCAQIVVGNLLSIVASKFGEVSYKPLT